MPKGHFLLKTKQNMKSLLLYQKKISFFNHTIYNRAKNYSHKQQQQQKHF